MAEEKADGARQLVVTLTPAAFEPAASRLRGALADRIEEVRRHDMLLGLETEAPLHPGGEQARGGLAVLESLERDGMLDAAETLVRPVGEEGDLSLQVALGEGRLAATAALSFSRRADRPSDEILSGTMLLTLVSPEAAAAAARRLSDAAGAVARVERVPVRELIAPMPASPGPAWHLDRIGAGRARQAPGYLDASTVTVATVDTGIDAGHQMLRPSLARYTSSWPGGPASDPRDLISHGTMVSGIIGANGLVDGVSRARLRVFKVFHDEVDTYLALQRADGSWFYQSSSAPDERMFVLALAAALDEDLPILNFSIGYQATHSKEEAIFAGFRRQGQAVVAATGNGGPGSPALFPAQYPDAIAVGALDRNDRAAAFSSPAPYTLVTAPGVDIVGTMPTYPGAEEYEAAIVNGNLERGRPIPWSTTTGTMSGTSAATPQVAAAAALWTARHGRNLPGLRDALARTARKVPEMGGAARTDSHGFGCIDLSALLA